LPVCSDILEIEAVEERERAVEEERMLLKAGSPAALCRAPYP
jgi:hypothetical protein